MSSTATRTVIASETSVNTAIRYDPSYVRTVPGILKVICFALNFLGFICILASKYTGINSGSFFNTVAMTGFWFTGILLGFYLFHVVEKFFRIPWLKIELIFCGLWAIFYLIAAIWVSTINSSAFTAAAFFGFCAMVVYGYDAFLKWKAYQAGEIAQGQRRIVSQQQTIITAPSAFPA